ncbi:PDR/VanB family oxidoreductase [Rhodococcus sp. HM1]|uniref:PDR/VanB family oxidoreductase n=1 Tax=unclassified Rhodococcus (in: high G+C Gram-positive bacteria) TaxID=192944 RepID=UPI0018CDA7A5|nr:MULTISPECIES: PDR/VanB family oxidoreductase [unclassified Rhodococcus (in: high G+C Gram-positive bacteria)]MBH0121844.1 oxidoreductase [Rhodococcus sp. CX]MCK8674837.1 PDR/VanB family oxidoreductase [Rhodococcus sp. HM1]
MTADTVDLMVRQMRIESTGVVSLRLEHPDGAAVERWTPGAHLDLHLGGGHVRQYSLCGDPDDKTGYRVAVLLEKSGRGGSRRVHETLRPGDTVAVSLPRNNFELLPSPRYLFIAGGIGITPILAMITEAERAGAEWELHYGGRDRSTMAFLDELAGYGDRVRVVAEDRDGMLDLAALLENPRPDTLVYTCGPEGLLAAVESYAPAWPDGAIRLERFKAPERIATAGEDASFQVVCESSGVSATVAPDRSILETLEDAGIDVPNSCREGICGSCETRVLCGTPDHRDSLLTAAEQESGATIMLCVSRARSDELVLDL